jgi:hypothetical protein
MAASKQTANVLTRPSRTRFPALGLALSVMPMAFAGLRSSMIFLLRAYDRTAGQLGGRLQRNGSGFGRSEDVVVRGELLGTPRSC